MTDREWTILGVIITAFGLIFAMFIAFFWGTKTIPDRVADWLGTILPTRKIARESAIIQGLNELFVGESLIHTFLTQLPVVQIVNAAYPLTKEQERLATEFRKVLEKENRNDPHAIVAESVHWRDTPLCFKAYAVEFHVVKALRASSVDPPKVLSGNVFVFCKEKKTLYLHRRAPERKNADTYPGLLHIFGGGHLPPLSDQAARSDNDLLATARREFHEEADASVLLENCPAISCEELRTGWIQVTFLGARVTPEQTERITAFANSKSAWEGKPVGVPFTQLHDVLLNELWVPTGKAAVLCWLALGAPGTTKHDWPKGQKPRQVYRRVTAVLRQRRIHA